MTLHFTFKSSHFEVLKGIQEEQNVTEISKYRKCSRQAVYNIISSLSNKGLISKEGYATYSLTQKGIENLHSFVALRYKLRQHNLHIKIEVLESPKNWELRRNEIRSMPYFNKTIKLKNNEQDLINFGRLQIKTTTKSLIIKMPTIYSKDWEDGIIQVMGILEELLPKLEYQFKVKLIKDYKSNIKIISQEYARIQDALAKLYRTENNRIYITGSDGKIWLITDLSFSTDELEFIHPIKATDDVDSIAPFLNGLRKNPTTMSDMKTQVLELQNVITSYAQNEIKHQRVLDEILLTFSKLNDRLDKAGL